MNRSCENCRFCIYAHSMRGKETPYCELHSEWIGDTLLCSEWEMVSVPKPQTNADRIRAMTDEELAEYLFIKTCEDGFPQFTTKNDWLDWLKQEVDYDKR